MMLAEQERGARLWTLCALGILPDKPHFIA
jgi:hypothetical protein